MMLLKTFAIGFVFTLGVEFALGLCFAFKAVAKGASKK